jgi:tol-pal system protein YbgF
MSKKLIIRRWILLLVASSLGYPVSAQVENDNSLETRLTRLEHLVNNSTFLELLERLEHLQKEVRDLRGELEMQGHQITQLKEEQRELYRDVDQRIQRFDGVGNLSGTSTMSKPSISEGPVATSYAKMPLPATSSSSSVPAPAPHAQEDGKNEYQRAVRLLNQGHYEEAIAALQTLLETHPSDTYTADARYWVGEAYYVTRQFQSAMQEFQQFVKDNPSSLKLTHALLKIGYIHEELGEKQSAEQVLSDLIERYPDTTAAYLAMERLQRLRKKP